MINECTRKKTYVLNKYLQTKKWHLKTKKYSKSYTNRRWLEYHSFDFVFERESEMEREREIEREKEEERDRDIKREREVERGKECVWERERERERGREREREI